jgi:hypothetical protein
VCDGYKFSYTILPLEKVFDIGEELDLKAPDEQEKEKVLQEKAKDELEHS